MLFTDLIPWLCWLFPTFGAVAAVLLNKANRQVMNITVIVMAALGWIMALLLLPNLLNYNYVDKQAFWFSLGGGKSLGVGMLIDPLSIILINVVALLGFLIVVYSTKYMKDDPNLSRFWFFMSLFISSMLLLVLADNLILMFVGWKLVGLCSFGLIGYYYQDKKENWIGGPAPFPFQKPSRAALKALLVTTLADMALLAGIIIIYLFSGTFNFITLIQTAGTWLPAMAATPGVLAITCVLLLLGPFGKSAQFPFHEWLPEAMAGPTPVSALIHAATMVKAGVYLIARLLPIFFFAAWIATPAIPEALTFFIFAAAIGAFSAFLAGSQAIVAKELKKALAYSTMSSIGYMVLALGVAGLSSSSLVEGTASGIFFLINHGIFKVILFLCAGVVIHASGSIYLSEMKLSRQKMRYTWAFMWIGTLALVGVPLFSGFWSKDSVLAAAWSGGQYLLFTVGLVTVIMTAFYSFRMMGMIFHGGSTITAPQQPEQEDHMDAPKHEQGEASWVMLAPIGILAVITMVIGFTGPLVSSFLTNAFDKYFTDSLGLVIPIATSGSTVLSGFGLEIVVAVASTLMIIVGAYPAWRLYVQHKSQPEIIIAKSGALKSIYNFLWNRWYIDAFYNKVFVNTTLALREPLQKYIESPLDRAINRGVPASLEGASKQLKKIQTGILSINMLYFLVFLVIVFVVLWLGGFL
jgi:NADH-quinone oxidoreductase subunit L